MDTKRVPFSAQSDDEDFIFLDSGIDPKGGPPRLVHLQPSSYFRQHSLNSTDSNDNNNNDDDFFMMDGMSRRGSMGDDDIETLPCVGDQLSKAVNREGSIVDGLLLEIYDKWNLARRDSVDSDDMTECSSTSEFIGRGSDIGDDQSPSEKRHGGSLTQGFLQNQSLPHLKRLLFDMQRSVAVMNIRLVRQLKRRDHRQAKLQRNCDIVTAVLQAASLKRQIDTRMKFSIQPPPGQSAHEQWRDAMKAVCRLPLGVPSEFRKKVWLSLADHYFFQLKINWDKTVRFVFNERSNPDDHKLGMQIVKDLHRTGCSNFSGEDNDSDRAVLKRLLLAYARWNKRVGYCQGFNVIAALLLTVMDRNEVDALKVMIYLVDSVLPESYFANNLRALSVDMAVFRDLLRLTYPRLSKHLDDLQMAATDGRTGACYEPPLTNVFTMQWFLTLFATCLPMDIVLRVWDTILLEGSEILLRSALTIWGKLAKRIMDVTSADEFYCLMGELSATMMAGNLMDGDTMVKSIYALGDFPLCHLHELRERYTFDIRPFTPAASENDQGEKGKKGSKAQGKFKPIFNSDDDDFDDEDITAMASMPDELTNSPSDISLLGPGVYGPREEEGAHKEGLQSDRMNTDIHSLKMQYNKLKQRQQQAHIIIAGSAASAKQAPSSRSHRKGPVAPPAIMPAIECPKAMNHLFVGKSSRSKNRMVAEAPRILAPATGQPRSGLLAKQLQAVANAKAVSKSRRMRTGLSARRPSTDHVTGLVTAVGHVTDQKTSVKKPESQNNSIDEQEVLALPTCSEVKMDGEMEVELVVEEVEFSERKTEFNGEEAELKKEVVPDTREAESNLAQSSSCETLEDVRERSRSHGQDSIWSQDDLLSCTTDASATGSYRVASSSDISSHEDEFVSEPNDFAWEEDLGGDFLIEEDGIPERSRSSSDLRISPDLDISDLVTNNLAMSCELIDCNNTDTHQDVTLYPCDKLPKKVPVTSEGIQHSDKSGSSQGEISTDSDSIGISEMFTISDSLGIAELFGDTKDIDASSLASDDTCVEALSDVEKSGMEACLVSDALSSGALSYGSDGEVFVTDSGDTSSSSRDRRGRMDQAEMILKKNKPVLERMDSSSSSDTQRVYHRGGINVKERAFSELDAAAMKPVDVSKWVKESSDGRKNSPKRSPRKTREARKAARKQSSDTEDSTCALQEKPTDFYKHEGPPTVLAFPPMYRSMSNQETVLPDGPELRGSSQPVIRKVGQKTMVVGRKPPSGMNFMGAQISGSQPNIPAFPSLARKASKSFDPFPVKHFNNSRAKAGIKLGLYSSKTIEQFRGFKPRTSTS